MSEILKNFYKEIEKEHEVSQQEVAEADLYADIVTLWEEIMSE